LDFIGEVNFTVGDFYAVAILKEPIGHISTSACRCLAGEIEAPFTTRLNCFTDVGLILEAQVVAIYVMEIIGGVPGS
jgi:hypothetical protein